MFRNWELPDKLKAKYAAPICEVSKFENCSPWAKKGSKINFQYTWDVDRLNNCGEPSVDQNRTHGSYYQGKLCGNDNRSNRSNHDIVSAEDWTAHLEARNKRNGVQSQKSDCCKNMGMYTEYRGRCTGYQGYMRKYNPANSI